MYKIVYAKGAVKDIDKIKNAKLKEKTINLIEIIRNNPYQNPPLYEKLLGELNGFYSRRINIQHRLVYQVFEDKKIVRILSMWTHYEQI